MAEAENLLGRETSPYLLQHAANPVDWYPWGEEAFARASREDKPVFLSIGYATCHWCHIMAHESFEDEDVAALLNRDFVCIKVDREMNFRLVFCRASSGSASKWRARLARVKRMSPSSSLAFFRSASKISSLRVEEKEQRWLLQVGWADHKAEFAFAGFFAERFARLAEESIRAALPQVLPATPKRRAVSAG